VGRGVGIAGSAALVLGAAVAALMLAPPLLGLDRYVVTGRSMTGTYDRGSIVLERAVPVGRLRVGDVITYAPPPSSGKRGLVTHRIVSLRHDRGGAPVLRTRGDANASVDPWTFTLARTKQPRVVAAVPLAGYAFAALGVRAVRMGLIGLPALALAVSLLVGLWREARAAERGLAKA
jgi:signal peptidase